MKLKIDGQLKRREKANVLSAFERMGFEVTQGDDGLVTATRPDVISKPEFVDIVELAELESRLYAGISWGRLFDLARSKQGGRYVDLPLKVMHGSWSGKSSFKPNLIIADTIAPTAEWLEENAGRVVDPVVNDRFICLVRSVGEKCVKL